MAILRFAEVVAKYFAGITASVDHSCTKIMNTLKRTFEICPVQDFDYDLADFLIINLYMKARE